MKKKKETVFFKLFLKLFFKSFTLVEMLVVIAIIMLIIGVSFTALSNRQNYEYKAEVDKIYKIITDAQANATKSSPIVTVGNSALNGIGFRLPTNIPQVPNNQSYIVSLRITKILNNNATLNDTLIMEFFDRLNRRLVIGTTNTGLLIQQGNPFNIRSFYDQNVFLNFDNTTNIGNYPISYMVLIRNNNNQFLPIIFRTNGSLAANNELYVRISHSSNRFRTYLISIRGKDIKKYVR